MSRKGILLTGGSGTRLYPLTRVVSKQLLPVYDMPMVYYPLSTLMLAGIRDVLVISTPRDLPQYEALLGTGEAWGMSFRYAVQPRPEGIPQALVIGRDFLAGLPCALALGDNILFGQGLSDLLTTVSSRTVGATVFGYRVRDPGRYAVAELDGDGNLLALEEKPSRPASNCAVTGLYFYDHEAPELAAMLHPSARGETEITDLNREYLRRGRLTLEMLGRGMAWLDTGTHEALHAASAFVQALETRQGLKIACPEEVAYRMGFIGREQLARLAASLGDGNYADYLTTLLSEG